MSQATTAEMPNNEADIEERIKAFDTDLRPLLGKYELQLAAEPVIMPDGRLAGRPVVVSTRKPIKPETLSTE